MPNHFQIGLTFKSYIIYSFLVSNVLIIKYFRKPMAEKLVSTTEPKTDLERLSKTTFDGLYPGDISCQMFAYYMNLKTYFTKRKEIFP